VLATGVVGAAPVAHCLAAEPLPFRLLGIAVEGVFDLLRAILSLPARVIRGPSPT